MATNRLTLTVQEAGTLLGISRTLAYDLVRRGEIPSLRIGRRVVVPVHVLMVQGRATATRATVDVGVPRLMSRNGPMVELLDDRGAQEPPARVRLLIGGPRAASHGAKHAR
jgi:excisionase family DNA binding protein